MPVLRWETWSLAAILGFAAVLRVIGLNADLWYDEVLTLLNYTRLPADELAVTFGSLNNHILYSWLTKLSTGVFGESAWAMRLPAVLLGLGAIWATWLLIRRIAPRHIALLTALLLAISYHHVWFSQNARGYTGLMFFTTLSCWFLIRAKSDRSNQNWSWLGYALCIFGGLATHLSAAFFFLAQGLVMCGFGFREVRQTGSWKPLVTYISACLVGLVLTALLLAPLVPQIVGSIDSVREVAEVSPAGGQSADIAEWRNPLWTLFETMRSFGAIGMILPVATGLAIWGGVKLYKSDAVTALTYGAAIGLTLLILISLSFRIWPRYFFHEIGFLITACVCGAFALADCVGHKLNQLREVDTWPRRLKFVGSGVIIAASVVILLPNYAYPKQNVSKAIAYVDAHNTSAAPVITAGLAGVLFTDYAQPNWANVESVDALEAQLSGIEEMWLVTAFPSHFETKHPDLLAFVQEHSDPEDVTPFSGTLGGGDIQVWHLTFGTDTE